MILTIASLTAIREDRESKRYEYIISCQIANALKDIWYWTKVNLWYNKNDISKKLNSIPTSFEDFLQIKGII